MVPNKNADLHWGDDLATTGPRYGFDSDELRLERQPLVKTLDYWNKIRGERSAPSRDDFDPIDVGEILRNIFLVEVLDDGDYFYRVVGTTIVNHVGFDATQKKLSALSDRVDVRRIASDFDDHVRRLMPRYDRAKGPWSGLHWRIYHRLLTPLSSDGATVDFILGCIDLETVQVSE